MSKKILVKEAALGKFLQSFFIAKANGKDNEFINKLDKVSPKVAAMWDDLNNTINSDIAKQYRYLKSKGFDTSALDDYIKSNNITV
jgi:uncharacterized protein (UPF0335 family)